MKKVAFLTMLLLPLLLLAACTSGSYSALMAVENNTFTSMQMRYQQFNGYKAKELRLNEGETCEVTVDIVSDEGSLSLSITDQDGESYYQGTDLPTSNFSVSLDKAGDYTIRIDAQKHSGSYDISWETAKA